jgi:hypothetical protein
MAADRFPGVLRERDLHLGDNGRVFCGRIHCAGSSAYASGHTISGHPVERMTVADARAWRRELGSWPRCEGCGQEFQVLVTERR